VNYSIRCDNHAGDIYPPTCGMCVALTREYRQLGIKLGRDTKEATMTTTDTTPAPQARFDLGWPMDRGPRHTLSQLGLIRSPDSYLRWVDRAAVSDRHDGTVFYTCRAHFINSSAIRALAALTFEGYLVKVHSLPGEPHLRITITEGRVEIKEPAADE
jgi:hypothetical protein